MQIKKLTLKSLDKLKNKATKKIGILAIAMILSIAGILLASQPKSVSLASLCDNAELNNIGETLINPHQHFTVKITADDKTTEIRTTGTVEDVLLESKISVGEEDIINYSENTPLKEGMEISVTRVEYIEKTETIEIPYKTVYKESESYEIGYEETICEGEDGEIQNLVKYTYKDGELYETEILNKIETPAIEKVIIKGTAEVNPIEEISISELDVPSDLVTDDNLVPKEYEDVITGKAVAYYADENALTASGRTVKVGYVAVNPDIIPYGTELFIVSTDKKYVYGYAIAADTGGSLLNNTVLVDLFMEGYDECVDWGAKQVDIYIL